MMRISTPSLLLLAWLSVGCTFGDKSSSSDDDASESEPWGDGAGGAGTPDGDEMTLTFDQIHAAEGNTFEISGSITANLVE